MIRYHSSFFFQYDILGPNLESPGNRSAAHLPSFLPCIHPNEGNGGWEGVEAVVPTLNWISAIDFALQPRSPSSFNKRGIHQG